MIEHKYKILNSKTTHMHTAHNVALFNIFFFLFII